MRVVVVSADPGVRRRATSRMAGDVEVIEVASASGAHRLVAAQDFDVLVIDGDLDPEGGFSLLYEIRQAGLLLGEPTPPALLLVGREQDRWLANWAGANRVLVKPADPFVVAEVVGELAGARAPEPAPHDVSEREVEAALARDEVRPS